MENRRGGSEKALQNELKQKAQELRRFTRTLRAHSNVSLALLRAQAEADFMKDVCRIIVKDCGHAMVWIGLARQDKDRTVEPVASAGFEEGYLDTLKITWADTERGRGPTGTAIRTGQVSMCRNMLTDPAFEPWRKEAIQRGYSASIALPLKDGRKTFGAIMIYAHDPDPFSEEDVKLLSELASDLAYGILAIRSNVARTRAEEAVRLSEQRYHSLFNSMTEGFALYDIVCGQDGKPSDYRFQAMNPAFERLTGLRQELLEGKLMSQVEQLRGEDPRWLEIFGKVALTGDPAHFENYSTVAKKHFTAFAYRPAPNQVAVIFMDITERQRAEEELQKARVEAEHRAKELGATIQSIADGVMVYDLHGRVQMVNPAAREMLGFDPSNEDLSGLAKTLSTHTLDGHPLDPDHSPTARALRGEKVSEESFILHTPRGEEMIVVASALPLRTGDQITGAVVTWHDITEQHKTEKALAWLASFPERNPQVVAVVDFDGNITYLNPAGKRLFPDFQGDMYQHPFLAGSEAIMEKLREGQVSSISREVAVNGAWYKQTWLYMAEYHCVRIYSMDITDRIEVETALQEMNARLEEGVRKRTNELHKANEKLQQDINRRIKVEKALKVEQKRFNDVLEILPAYLILLTPDYHVSFANRYFREHFGESHGRCCYEYLFGRSEPCENCETYKVLATKSPHHWEWTGPDSHIYDVYDFPFTDSEGSSLILEMGIDITERVKAQDKLLSLNAYNRSLIEASLDPLVTITSDGKVGDVNSATEKVTGRSRQELIGTDFHSYFSDPESARAGYQQVFETGSVRDYELEIRHTDGHLTPVLYNAAIYRDEAGKVQGVFAAARDISDRKQAEAEIEKHHQHLEQLVRERTYQLEVANAQLRAEIIERERTEHELAVERSNLQMIFDAANVGMLQLGSEGSVKRANHVIGSLTGKEFERIRGLQPGNALGCIHALENNLVCGNTPYCSMCQLRNTFETALKTGQPIHDIEAEMELQLGESPAHLWLEVSADPLLMDGEQNVILAINNITARKQAEEELRQAHDELELRIQERTQELNRSNQQLRLENEERQRMADSLHDAVNQSMFSAGLIAEVMPRLWEQDQKKARQSLKDLRKLTRSAQGEMRALLAELRPSIVTNNGLDYFLEQLSNAFIGRTGLPVATTLSGEMTLPPVAQVVFYRVAQEALNNIAKHAKASRVEIDFRNESGRATMRIMDDGRGFDIQKQQGHHYGLKMIQERAETIGAELLIDSQPGHGTQLRLTWKEEQP